MRAPIRSTSASRRQPIITRRPVVSQSVTQRNQEALRARNAANASTRPQAATPTPTGNNTPSGNFGNIGGSGWNGGGGGSGAYSPPAAPQPRRLSYQELLAMANGDPAMLEELANFRNMRNLARSQTTQNQGLLEEDYGAEMNAANRMRDENQRLTAEEAAAAGRYRSGSYARALDLINAGHAENTGRLTRQRNMARTQLEQALASGNAQFDQAEVAARQNAIARLLAQRSDITRGY